MGVLDKFLDAIKLNDDYDDDGFLDDDLLDEEEDDDFLDDDFDEKPKKKFFDKFSKKKESDDNDDFDDVEEKAVKTAPKQASAPKQTASAPSKVTVKQERPTRSNCLTRTWHSQEASLFIRQRCLRSIYMRRFMEE